MIVRCTSNDRHAVADEHILKLSGVEERYVLLTPGSEYVVYALGALYGILNVFVYNDGEGVRDNGAPFNYPIYFFEILDPRLSRHWILNPDPMRQVYRDQILMAHKSWFYPGFYEGLVDGRKNEIKLWKKVKNMIDSE